jgi:hypothetical protein
MTCPRCAFADVTGETCPRCGVIVAKARDRRRPPADEPLVMQEDFDEEPSGSRRTIVVVVGVVALLAASLYLTRRPARPAPVVAGTGASTAEAPTPRDVAAGPPPSLAGFVPPPIQLLRPPTEGAPDADHAAAAALVSRLDAPATITDRDIQAAEELLASHSDQKSLRDLVEALLIASAGEDHKRRQFGKAVTRLERAAAVQPTSVRPWQGLLQVHMDSGDWRAAEAAARGAIALEPRNADAWRGLGYALLRQDRNREAAEALRTALEIQDHPETRLLLARVSKAQSDEQGMTEQHLSHFNVRYDGDTHEAVGREILRALERHYATLASSLDYQPSATIPVILFSRQAYFNASGAPAWSGGVYDSLDGRIRIPIGGLTSTLTPDMDQTLIHELTHAFLAERTRGVATREVQEGMAQYMEGRRIGNDLTGPQLTALADGRIPGVMGYYLSALSFVEYLIGTRGMGGMNDLVKAMGETGDVNAAFKQVYGTDYEATQQSWADRLRRQHGS